MKVPAGMAGNHTFVYKKNPAKLPQQDNCLSVTPYTNYDVTIKPLTLAIVFLQNQRPNIEFLQSLYKKIAFIEDLIDLEY